MMFVSYEFLAFLFAAAVLYYVLPKRCQWMLLLAASLLFYVSSGTRYVAYILATAVTIYGLAVVMDSIREKGKEEIREKGLTGTDKKVFRAAMQKRMKRVMLLGVFFNLGILLVVKYTNFAIWNINYFLSAAGSSDEIGYVGWLLPLGISYYTLQALGYLLDVYHGTEKAERNPFKLLLFLSFFPQVVQGPISRFGRLKESLFAEHGWSSQRVCRGLERMLWGFFKKLVVADRVAPVVIAVGQNAPELDGVYVLMGMLAYTLQLYGDFTGGIDIALGCAEVFGVELPENFDRPFGSESLAEYWRRWHMTLMQWFREYVFYPMAGSSFSKNLVKTGEKLFGKKTAVKLPVYAVSLVTWFLTGIWHGASWNFVIWGLVNCVILLVSQELVPVYREVHKRYSVTNTAIYRRFMILRTLLLVSTVQMFEYYPSPKVAISMFFGMFASFRSGGLFDERWAMLGIGGADVVLLVLFVVLFCLAGRIKNRESVRDWVEKRPAPARFVLWFGMFLAVLIFGIYGQGYDASQFIYNQF